jgi:hypothetical protein
MKQLLAGLYPEGLREGEFLEIRLLPSRKQLWFASVDQLSQEIGSAIRNQGADGVYFGVNPRRERRGDNDAVSRIVTLVADIDVPDGGAELFATYGLQPSALVYSGGGYHAYWFLRESLPESEDLHEVRREFLRLGPSDHVHDAARVMRVPGSLNTKYNPPKVCADVFVKEKRRYPASLFAKVARLSERIRRLLFLGENSPKTFKSPSELAWTILLAMVGSEFTYEEALLAFASSPANIHFRRDWPHLMQYEYKRAVAYIEKDGEKPGRRIVEEDNCYWYTTKNGRSELSTWVLTPTHLLVGTDEDYIQGRLQIKGSEHVWPSVRLPRGVFSSSRKLDEALKFAGCSWYGNDFQARQLRAYLMERIRDLGVPHIAVTDKLGRHGALWVTVENVLMADRIITFDEAGITYHNQRLDPLPMEYSLVGEDEYRDLMKRALSLVFELNVPEVTYTALGWLFASPYKPLLGPQGTHFPVLLITGAKGSGKTTLIQRVLLPLAGYTKAISWSCDATPFAHLILLGATTSVPVHLSEYRPTVSHHDSLTHKLRQLYDSGQDLRGRPDQSTVQYLLSSPVVMDGEFAFDDPALVDRAVVITLVPQNLTPERAEVLERVTRLPLDDLAGRYVQFTLRTDALAWYERARRRLQEIWRDQPQLSHRTVHNFSVVCVGLRSLVEFAKTWGVTLPKLDDLYLQMLATNPEVSGGVVTRLLAVDDMVTDVVAAVARIGIGVVTRESTGASICHTDPFIWRYDSDDAVLWLHLPTVLTWWAKERAHQRRFTLDRTAAMSQLLARQGEGGYYLGQERKHHTYAGTLNMLGISLPRAQALKLDIPDRLRIMGVSTKHAG